MADNKAGMSVALEPPPVVSQAVSAQVGLVGWLAGPAAALMTIARQG